MILIKFKYLYIYMYIRFLVMNLLSFSQLLARHTYSTWINVFNAFIKYY